MIHETDLTTPGGRPVSDGVITLDAEGRVATIDGAAERLLGHPAEDLLGRTLAGTLFADFHREEFERRLERVGRAPAGRASSERFESRVIRADHSEAPVEITLLAVPWNSASVRVVFLRDLRTGDGLAMPSSEAWEDEVAFSAEIQKKFLRGRVPDGVRGLEIATLSLASRGMEGDFFDFFRHGDGRLDVVVGDVMGKGISAALLGSAARSEVLRSIGSGGSGGAAAGPEPEAIVRSAHRAMTARLLSMGSFVTLCYARFDLEAREVTFVDAGHPRTLHYQAGRDAIGSLQGGNLPIGVREDEEYTQRTLPFGPGDVFVFYSDGVTDPPGADGQALGEDGLREILLATAGGTPNDVIGAIRAAIEDRWGGDGLRDDVTCVVVKASAAPVEAGSDDALHEEAGLDTFGPGEEAGRETRRRKTSRRVKRMLKG